jgi:hypothetical protein
MNPTTIMTASHSHAGATPPNLELKIKRWVELDNQIKSTAEEVRDIRTEKQSSMMKFLKSSKKNSSVKQP